ncbi:MAG: NADH-quinone oxidoreductase subunit H [Planctomycetota bacterium]
MNLLLGILLAPLLSSLILRTKALVAGRQGPPWLQPYFDIAKLLQKGAVYSRTATGLFVAGPIGALSATLLAAALIPLGGCQASVSFEGDLFLFAGLLAAARFLSILAALDVGLSFEGMGASREALYGALAEPALFLALAAGARGSGSLSLSGIFASPLDGIAAPALALLAGALLVVALAECARIPFDDPATHLELTMVHEVMVLDHGGPDLAFIEYASSLKFWILGTLLGGFAMPIRIGGSLANALLGLGAVAALGVAIGAVESTMARLKLQRVPQLLVGAGVLAAVALVLGMR